MRKKDDTLRDTLLGLAREVAEEQGPEAINIRDIARRAGVATGTVYNYFSGKDELLLALTEDCWREALGELETAIPPGRVSDRLGEVFRLLRRQMDAPGGRLRGRRPRPDGRRPAAAGGHHPGDAGGGPGDTPGQLEPGADPGGGGGPADPGTGDAAAGTGGFPRPAGGGGGTDAI